jgi:hypothetical protein
MKRGTVEMLTAKQFAERAKVSYPTVMKWLRDDFIPGAKKVASPIFGDYWEIPASSLRLVSKRKPGPKPGTKHKKKRVVKAAKQQGG